VLGGLPEFASRTRRPDLPLGDCLQSPRGKANSCASAMADTFNKTIKSELIWPFSGKTIQWIVF
jgi:hypothetical protein